MIKIESIEPMTMQEIEKQAITQTMEIFNGNKSKAAKALKLGRATMYRKLNQYSIETKAHIEKTP